MSPIELDALNTDMGQFVHTLWLVLASAAGLGIATMVILQLAKDLFPIRRAWQRRHIKQWLGEQASLAGQFEAQQMEELNGELRRELEADVSREARDKIVTDFQKRLAQFREPPNSRVAEADLIKLACAGRAWALYSLPVEQLAGQASTALQFVVDYPAGNEDLLRLMATGVPLKDLATLFEAAKAEKTPESNEMDKIVDARTRISHVVQRNLDAFQISIASRWKLYLQLIAILFSVGLMSFLVSVFPPNRGALEYVQGAVIGILGGFMSSAAWDLFAMLKNRRNNS